MLNEHIDCVEVFKSHMNNQWYFRVWAPNSRIIASSEGYHNKQDCMEEAIKLFPDSIVRIQGE